MDDSYSIYEARPDAVSPELINKQITQLSSPPLPLPSQLTEVKEPLNG